MIPLTPIRRRIRELWDSGVKPFDIAEQVDASVDAVRVALYASGISFQQARERDAVFVEKTCHHCARTFKRRKVGGLPTKDHYCSAACVAAATAAMKQPRSAEQKRAWAIKFAIQRREAHAEHGQFMRSLNIKKAIRAHDDAEADRAVKRP